MPVPVKLQDVIDQMDTPGAERAVYLNQRTGEFVAIPFVRGARGLTGDAGGPAVNRESQGV